MNWVRPSWRPSAFTDRLRKSGNAADDLLEILRQAVFADAAVIEVPPGVMGLLIVPGVTGIE